MSIKYDFFHNISEWHRQQTAKEYLSEYGWDALQCTKSTDICEPTGEPLLGSHFMSQEIESIYNAAFRNILLKDNIQLDLNSQYTVRWFTLSNYFLEDYPIESTLRANVLMHEDDVICATLTWSDVLQGFQVQSYVKYFDCQWCGEAFSYDNLNPEHYYPVTWSIEQILSAFNDTLCF